MFFGDIMKRKTVTKIKGTLFVLSFGIAVFTAGYFYLNNILNSRVVNDSVQNVPYYTATPKNATVLFNICEDKLLLNLNFKEETVNVIFGDEENHGYNITHTISCDYNTVGYFVDLIGGVDFDDNRHTGAHITELLEYSYVSENTKREITESIIKGISEIGFTKENLLYLIENTETDLKFNECYFWVDYIGKLCKFPRFIN